MEKNYNKYKKHDKSKSKKIWRKLLKRITPADGYDVEDYYGVALLRLKKNGDYQIKLIHDYGKRSIMSSSIVEKDQDKALKMYEILDWFAKDEHLRVDDVDDIDLDEEDSEDENIEFDESIFND